VVNFLKSGNRDGGSRLYFTPIVLCLLLIIYAYMSGVYMVQKVLQQPTTLTCLNQRIDAGDLPYAPSGIMRWESGRMRTGEKGPW
jgi:hypothetical protein